MEDWQQRVIEEKAELDEKMKKLYNFLVDTKKCEEDLKLLRVQASLMKAYTDVLELRIKGFK